MLDQLRAKAAYGRQGDMPVPPDLQRFLDENDDAAEFFASLSSTNRYAFLFRLQTARRPETRAKRFAEFTSMLKAGKKFHP